MADYISREAALKAAEHAYGEWNLAMAAADGARQINLVYKRQELLKAVASVFDIVPTADVEPVRHGRWEEYTHSYYCGVDEYGEPRWVGRAVYYCYNPKCRRKTVVKEKYCPSCGAKMDLEDDNGT